MKPLIKFLDQKGLSSYITLFADILFYFLSFLTAFSFRNYFLVKYADYLPVQNFREYLITLPFVFLTFVVTFYFFGLYGKQNRITRLGEVLSLTKALTLAWLLIMSAAFLQRYDYSRILVIFFWTFSLIYINIGRLIVRKIQLYLYKKNVGITKVLIIGCGKWGLGIANQLKNYKDFGYKLIGFIDNNTKPKKEEYQYLGNTKNLLDIIKTYKIDQVYIADPSMSHENILNLMHNCEGLKVQFKVVSDLFEIVSGGIDINEIEGIPTLDLSKNENKKVYEFIKRMMDLSLGLILSTISIPFAIIIIFAIKFSSKGKAVFIQERVGEKEKLFKMYKFRTMYKNVDENSYAPRNNSDNRITNVGKFLRKTSLDELPQLINVIKGEMSLVGPRPEMPFIVAKYKDWQKKRLEVKPGLTGLWQVLGRKDLPLHENLEYDFYYIKNRSILLDLIILFKTITAVLFQRGAY